MHNILTIAGKELRVYFISPIFYVVAGVFLLISDFLFFRIASVYSELSIRTMQIQGVLPQLNLHQSLFRPTFLNTAVVLLLIMPMFTMRLFAEEKKARTAELLLTSPISVTELVMGKYLAAVLVYLLLLLATLHIPIMMSFFAGVEWKPLAASYLGMFLLGSLFLAFGLFASSLTENQIIAAAVSLGIFLFLWLIGILAQAAGGGAWGAVAGYFSIIEHLDNFTKGLIDSRDVTYFLSAMILGLFLTHRVVESQRWKS